MFSQHWFGPWVLGIEHDTTDDKLLFESVIMYDAIYGITRPLRVKWFISYSLREQDY